MNDRPENKAQRNERHRREDATVSNDETAEIIEVVGALEGLQDKKK